MSPVEHWTVEEVCAYLALQGMNNDEALHQVREKEIDGETLLILTERMVESIFPTFKLRAKFIKLQERLNSKCQTPQQSETAQLSTPVENQQLPPEPVTPVSSRNWGAYKLPDFPPLIQTALEKQDSIFKSAGRSHVRNSLIQVLFDDMSKTAWYPDRKVYANILGTLCTRYPFLRDSSMTGYEILRDSLRNKFKKERKPLLSVDEISAIRSKYSVMGSGRKRKAAEDLPPTIVKRKRIIFAEDDQHEDNYSITKHLENMQREMERARPCPEVLCDLLSRTQSAHKKLLEDSTTSDFLKQCPYFRIPALIFHQMEKQFKVNAVLSLHETLPSIKDGVMNKAKGSPLYPFLIQEIDEEIEELRKIGMEKSATIMLLSHTFKEKSDLFFTFDEEPISPTPTMLFHNQKKLGETSGTIKMDSQIVANIQSSDPLENLACVFCMYFLHGVQYPKGLKNTLTYIEHFLVKVPQSGSSTERVSAALHRAHTGLLSGK